MTQTEFDSILKSHSKWLLGRTGGVRANPNGAPSLDFRNADLRGVNMSNLNLRGADLYGANLSYANLTGADLSYANLTDANLTDANLYGAILSDANLTGAKLPDFQICPQDGAFIGYKKVRGDTVLKLRIEGPRTNSLVGRKCRTSKAFVVEAIDSFGGEFKSMHDPNFKYTVGKYVEVPDYDPDIRVECTRGIHFFMTLEEARDY